MARRAVAIRPEQESTRPDWANGDEPMTGARESYLETLSRKAGKSPTRQPDQGPDVRAASTRSSSRRGGAPRAPHSVAARGDIDTPSITRPMTTITLGSRSAGTSEPNAQKLIRTRLS